MLPPELSLRSPLPSPLAMNNSPPEGPMRFAKRVFLVEARCAEASDRLPSSRKNAVTLIPNLIMENLPCYWPVTGLLLASYRASYASAPVGTTDLLREHDPRSARLGPLVLGISGRCFAEPIPEMSLEPSNRSGENDSHRASVLQS